jgi:hypothetical protein
LSKRQERYRNTPYKPRVSLKDRFDRHVEKRADGCWEWTGAKTRGGYGSLGYERKTYRANRAAYLAYVGEIPPGMMVLHKCDNPSCVNPDHLWLGTHRENMADAVRKDRVFRGGTVKKLTAEAVCRLRSGGSVAEICREFGVTERYALSVRAGNTWKSLNA